MRPPKPIVHFIVNNSAIFGSYCVLC